MISATTRICERTQEERLSLFLYEELMAFRQTAEAINLTITDLAVIFHNNMRLDGTGSPA